MVEAVATVVEKSSWLASLELQLEYNATGTRLSRSRHNGPLYVQKPFYPEGRDHPHIYLLHPPGGIVSGDSLTIIINAKKNTGVLVTTPGAARIYRARDRQTLHSQQHQQVQLNIGKNAVLEWFPLETIVFNGADVAMKTTIDLDEGSRFVGWEITCFGLPARDEPFISGRFKQHYQVNQAGLPLFVDRLVLDDNHQKLLSGKAGMQELPVSGFFLIGPVIDEVSQRDAAGLDGSESVLVILREQVQRLDVAECAAISKVGEFYVGRYLGDSTEQARKIFTEWWRILRPRVIGREACPPRIWAT
ncbi:MAG: urease accessory protein UreD [Spongiibacteraceae bacterium]|jgi:urease accessory protein